MAIPGFPLPLRNALATITIAALDDDDARAALHWLVRADGTPPAPTVAERLVALHLIDPGATTLLAVHASHAGPAAEHAGRALRAAERHQPAVGDDALARASRHAVALWNERLFFEVHEVLEEVWKTATGDVRQALQGVIQIAVAFHHLAHGNQRGARSLMHEGRMRIASVPPSTLPALDLVALGDATASWEETLAGAAPAGSTPPTLVARPIPRARA